MPYKRKSAYRRPALKRRRVGNRFQIGSGKRFMVRRGKVAGRRRAYRRPMTKRSQPMKRIRAPALFTSLGLPLTVKGLLKSSIMSAAVDTPTGQFHFAYINLVDMNNDQRTGTADTNNGTSHIVTNVDGTQVNLRTPYYFDELAVHYRNYTMRKVYFNVEVSNQLAVSGSDITVAYKVFRAEDTQAVALLGSSVEILKSTPGMRFIKLNPAIATRTGNRSKRVIRGMVNVIKLVNKRNYYTNSAQLGPGEKDFTNAATWVHTVEFTPKIIFWAWLTFTEAVIGVDAMDCTMNVTHYYTAYDKIIPGVS